MTRKADHLSEKWYPMNFNVAAFKYIFICPNTKTSLKFNIITKVRYILKNIPTIDIDSLNIL